MTEPTDAELNELADAHTPNTETGSLNYRKFARAVLAKWGTPQPTQAQAGPAPLTEAQIDDMHSEANRGYCIELEHYTKAVRDAERAHDIKGGQHV